MKIVVVGGGYAGLSCLMRLAEILPESKRTLIDPSGYHLKLTRLHEGLRRPPGDLRIPFDRLARKYGFVHVAARPAVSLNALQRAAARRRLECRGLAEGFDALVVAVGVRPRPRPVQAGCIGLADLKRLDGRGVVDRIARDHGRRQDRVTVVGGGATGLQYLFELRDALRREGAGSRLALVDPGQRLLPDQPEQFHGYLSRRMEEAGISYLKGYRLSSAEEGQLLLVGPRGGARRWRSAVSLILTGTTGNPSILETAETGEVLAGGSELGRIFAAGDCSTYRGGGFDAASAQSAVRKGRLVAENLKRLAGRRKLRPYDAPELGFFLSMGVLDGIGWVGDRRAVVTGAPAFAVREAIEARYELFVRGIDTFGLL